MNILDLLFPKRCLNCWRFGKYFCDRCVSTIRFIGISETICPVCEKPAIDGATHPGCKTRYAPDGLTSFFRYDGVVRKAIKAIKYRHVFDLAKEFIGLVPSESFSQLLTMNHERFTLVPIPLHPSRFRERGFNQAEMLGRLLADRLHIPMRTDMLKRTKATIPQVEMKDRKDRLQNMKDVFAIHNSKFIIHNSTIILFDDVFTTGATMRAAGETLKRAGAPFVWSITMAR